MVCKHTQYFPVQAVKFAAWKFKNSTYTKGCYDPIASIRIKHLKPKQHPFLSVWKAWVGGDEDDDFLIIRR